MGGFIFATSCTLDFIREVLKKHRKSAAAKAGQISVCSLSIPSGPTGMDPSQTSFFQALNIGTKIVKGQIELISDFPVLKPGEKVSPGAAVLLAKLGIRPFEYGMEVESVSKMVLYSLRQSWTSTTAFSSQSSWP